MEKVRITSEYITLGQFLKFALIISNGGEAKSYLSSHKIKVNSMDENRRGKKLYPNDIIKCGNATYQIVKE